MTRPQAIVDTNVAVCANRKAPQASERCVLACIDRLDALRREGIAVLDAGGAMLEEYQRNLSFQGQPGVGDAFFLWLFTNKENRHRVRQVSITPHATRGYTEFPDDPALAAFDRNDRKFVAVAIAASKRRRPPILNATDSDYAAFRQALARHQVDVEELC